MSRIRAATYILVSGLIHLVVSFLLIHTATRETENYVIDFINEDGEDSLLADGSDTGFLANRDQQVSRQTRAPRGEKTPAIQSRGASSAREGKPVPPTNLSMADLGLSGSSQLLRQNLHLTGAVTNERTSEYLSDVPEGVETLLNARRYAHWLFVDRMKQQLAPVWEFDVQNIVDFLGISGLDLKEKEYVARVRATLDTQGKVLHVALKKQSELEWINEGAVIAFERAGPYPNPPRQLLDENGQMEIEWIFIITRGATRVSFAPERPQQRQRRDL